MRAMRFVNILALVLAFPILGMIISCGSDDSDGSAAKSDYLCVDDVSNCVCQKGKLPDGTSTGTPVDACPSTPCCATFESPDEPPYCWCEYDPTDSGYSSCDEFVTQFLKGTRVDKCPL